MYKVHIVDLQSGNLLSITNAIERLGYQPYLITDAADPEFEVAERLILPGVGNFGHFVDSLKANGFEELVMKYIASGKPLMGICVGLQALFKDSEESPSSTGLGLADFGIRKFNDSTKPVPEIGWNSVDSSWDLFYGLDPLQRYYFVHSFAAILSTKEDEDRLTEQGWKVATARYGEERFVAAISRNNVFATQFHPEKSGMAGLQVIKNFLRQQHPTLSHDKGLQLLLNNDYSNYGLTRRIIACLDVRTNDIGELVVTKGDQYDVREKGGSGEVRNLGNPVDLAKQYYEQGADEITFLNITSFRNPPLNDLPMTKILKRVAKTVFVPLTVGGGIKDTRDHEGKLVSALEIAGLYFRSGADKVSIGSDAVYAAEKYYERGGKGDGLSPIETISKRYGAQAVVISVDPKRVYVSSPAETKHRTIKTKYPNSKGQEWCWYVCTVNGGRLTRDIGVWELTRACEALGAGEILLNCMDKDGTNAGYDLELLRHVKSAVNIPVIASSGAGNPDHFVEAFLDGKVDACLGAGLFHRGEYTVNDVKRHLLANGLKVRLDLGPGA